MLDKATSEESLKAWDERNGIDLGDEDASIIGYWCRVSGVPLADESIRRNLTRTGLRDAREGWREADEDIQAEGVELA